MRVAPRESATLFKLGSKKKGLDGNTYIIVENVKGIRRWKLFKKSIIVQKLIHVAQITELYCIKPDNEANLVTKLTQLIPIETLQRVFNTESKRSPGYLKFLDNKLSKLVPAGSTIEFRVEFTAKKALIYTYLCNKALTASSREIVLIQKWLQAQMTDGIWENGLRFGKWLIFFS